MSLRISANDMLRVGDWIEMSQVKANGHAIEHLAHMPPQARPESRLDTGRVD